MSTIVSWDDPRPIEAIRKAPILKRRRGNQGGRTKNRYRNILTAWDTETTRLEWCEQSIMYVWAYQIGTEYTVIGRTWPQWIDFCQRMIDAARPAWIVTWVHNLSYEFAFLGWYPWRDEDVFAVDRRKVLRAKMWDGLELRCSYLHSNMSLDEYTRKMGVQHVKLSGADYDYSKIRYPWTQLTDRELAYIQHDVLGLVEALAVEMSLDDDNLYSVPLTSTGYVRRDCKHAMRTTGRDYVKTVYPSWDVYVELREAFRGGNTHASRFYAGLTLEDVHSADRSSSYPDVVCNCLFPVSPFVPVAYRMGLDEILRMIGRGRAILTRVRLTGVRLRDPLWGAPYLARDKCRWIRGGEYDNGRVLSAESLDTTVTDIDLRIILEEYEFDEIGLYDTCHARYGRLPVALTDVVRDYYARKTTLKGVDGQEVYYLKSKNKLNAIYGMMAQDPAKLLILYAGGEWLDQTDKTRRDVLEEGARRAFLTYAWGVWVTAWARLRLEEGIRLAGRGFVYADTDSVKYIGSVDWCAYNARREADSRRSGSCARDPAGVEHCMGVYETEDTARRFRTLGAKKYAYEDSRGKLHITVAGVSKKLGAAELEQMGGLDAFEEGIVFRDAGGTEAIYNDHVHEEIIVHDRGMTVKLLVTPNVTLRPSMYTLGITGEYDRLLRHAHELLRALDKT